MNQLLTTVLATAVLCSAAIGVSAQKKGGKVKTAAATETTKTISTPIKTITAAMPGYDKAIEEYLLTNKVQNVKTSPDGFYYNIDREGGGALAKDGEFVVVHYTGTLLSGKKFDSSVDRNEPFYFPVGKGQVIRGWDKGIPLFSVGSKGRLYLPSAVAYGAQGAGGDIPPNTPLIFDIEVLNVFPTETALQAYIQGEAAKKGAAQRDIDEKLIVEYATRNNLKMQRTASGLGYVIEKQGDGARAEANKNVKVHYSGFLLDGTKFDSSIDRGQPFEFPLGQGRVIKGWDEGIQLFNVGGKGKLIIPSSLAYGSRGVSVIPANSVLMFDIEVVDIK